MKMRFGVLELLDINGGRRMRQLNETGYMHNRVRMVVASFLCKHLLINWQGEAYFAEKLLDYEMSSNVGIGKQLEPVVMPHLISESLIHRFN
jgi:mannitol/fructose-specific phosphotransferase system IIA component (Ntr-type)